LEDSFDKRNWNFNEMLKFTVQSSSNQWFQAALACHFNAALTQEEGVQSLIEITDLDYSDSEKAISDYENILQV
jgi:hypothetical protein